MSQEIYCINIHYGSVDGTIEMETLAQYFSTLPAPTELRKLRSPGSPKPLLQAIDSLYKKAISYLIFYRLPVVAKR
ncbi:hypothetical protein H6G97_31795 [Nostoc flagelliforme FACHB-838]|uniref:Uncharacterized protein n=1 Tax=Nostoc flagelliforme FACHB-838 TaxID=2692904 RepID=A0ABR8DWN8_9NOSO|nr:hypothetical protein [Nostoc flagelliforme FACHB-838]